MVVLVVVVVVVIVVVVTVVVVIFVVVLAVLMAGLLTGIYFFIDQQLNFGDIFLFLLFSCFFSELFSFRGD